MAAGHSGKYGPLVLRRVGMEPELENELVPIPRLRMEERCALDRVNRLANAI